MLRVTLYACCTKSSKHTYINLSLESFILKSVHKWIMYGNWKEKQIKSIKWMTKTIFSALSE